ncbi:hypothetical protein OH764_35735 (plasmid) [Burkholderia sp. M6-3]
MLEEIEARGKMPWAVHVRSRMKVLCPRGKALGRMTENPATDTQRAAVTAKAAV